VTTPRARVAPGLALCSVDRRFPGQLPSISPIACYKNTHYAWHADLTRLPPGCRHKLALCGRANAVPSPDRQEAPGLHDRPNLSASVYRRYDEPCGASCSGLEPTGDLGQAQPDPMQLAVSLVFASRGMK